MSEPERLIITGATSGLGQEMALQFAARGESILACGRRQERLSDLEKIVGIKGVSLDLMSDESLSQFCSQREIVSGLILNAGITFADKFEAGDFETDAAVIQTNITANVKLLRGLLPALKAGRKQMGQARILIIASLGGLTPLPYQAVYAGSKAFMINFGLSLREELKHDGIKVSVFAPGGIKTEMTDIPAMKKLEKDLAPVADVAKAAIKAYDKMPALTVPGTQNKLISIAAKLAPKQFISAQAERIYRKALGDK